VKEVLKLLPVQKKRGGERQRHGGKENGGEEKQGESRLLLGGNSSPQGKKGQGFRVVREEADKRLNGGYQPAL